MAAMIQPLAVAATLPGLTQVLGTGLKPCSHLKEFYVIATSTGLVVREISQGWSEAKFVFHFNGRLPPRLVNAAQGMSAPISFYSACKAPHTPAEDGLYCSECKIGLSFPQTSA